MSISDAYVAPSQHELSILRKMLSIKFHGVEILTRQFEELKIFHTKDEDLDNYGSFLIQVINKDSYSKFLINPLPVEGLYHDIDGVEVGLLLHVKLGVMIELEVVKYNGSPLLSDIDPSRISLLVNV